MKETQPMPTTHTPGPWHIEHQVGNFYFVIPDGHTQHVATVSQWLQPTDANARLIAAAPALYAALQEIMVVMDNQGIRNSPTKIKARAALAAADGQEQP